MTPRQHPPSAHGLSALVLRRCRREASNLARDPSCTPLSPRQPRPLGRRLAASGSVRLLRRRRQQLAPSVSCDSDVCSTYSSPCDTHPGLRTGFAQAEDHCRQSQRLWDHGHEELWWCEWELAGVRCWAVHVGGCGQRGRLHGQRGVGSERSMSSAGSVLHVPSSPVGTCEASEVAFSPRPFPVSRFGGVQSQSTTRASGGVLRAATVAASDLRRLLVKTPRRTRMS